MQIIQIRIPHHSNLGKAQISSNRRHIHNEQVHLTARQIVLDVATGGIQAGDDIRTAMDLWVSRGRIDTPRSNDFNAFLFLKDHGV